MRQMAGDGEHEIMMLRRHHLDLGAHRGPERTQPIGRIGIRAFRRGQDAPAVDEELRKAGVGTGMFGAGDGMRRHEMHACRQMRRHVLDHRALDRADVGNDRTSLQVGCDLLRHRPASADGNAEDHEVGVRDGLHIALDHAVDNAELGDPRPGLLRARGGDDLAGEVVDARRACDRPADQAEADQRDPFEMRCAFVAHFDVPLAPMKSRRPSTTRRLASSVPMVMRSALGSW